MNRRQVEDFAINGFVSSGAQGISSGKKSDEEFFLRAKEGLFITGRDSGYMGAAETAISATEAVYGLRARLKKALFFISPLRYDLLPGRRTMKNPPVRGCGHCAALIIKGQGV